MFRLDPATGGVRFGNGWQGKIPPAGTDAVRAIVYQAGGGAVGNVPALTIVNVKSAVESLDGVLNPVDAGGGADTPTAASLAWTAPARLRYGNQALTPADIEALTLASAPDIAAVRWLGGRGGGFDLVVATREAGVRLPVPTRARREGIAANLAAHGWGALGAGAIRVRAPAFVQLHIKIELIAVRPESVAEVEDSVARALLTLLDPTGRGPDGSGWRFGRPLWPSDVYRALDGVPSIDLITALEITAADVDLEALAPDALIWAGSDDIEITVMPGEPA